MATEEKKAKGARIGEKSSMNCKGRDMGGRVLTQILICSFRPQMLPDPPEFHQNFVFCSKFQDLQFFLSH